MSTQPLVLVADDEPRITKLVSIALGEEGFRVVTANGGEEALLKAEEVRPDIVLLDIVMPDLDGIEVMRQLRERRPVAVILLTAKGSTADKAKGLDLGADDYIAKPFHPDELAARVRAVLRRSSGAQPGAGVVKFDDVEIDLERRMVTRSGELVQLSRTEWLLLQHLAANAGKVVLHTELLTKVWGPEYRDDLQYLRVWVSRVRRKLGAAPGEPGRIRTFQGIGYLLDVEPPATPAEIEVRGPGRRARRADRLGPNRFNVPRAAGIRRRPVCVPGRRVAGRSAGSRRLLAQRALQRFWRPARPLVLLAHERAASTPQPSEPLADASEPDEPFRRSARRASSRVAGKRCWACCVHAGAEEPALHGRRVAQRIRTELGRNCSTERTLEAASASTRPARAPDMSRAQFGRIERGEIREPHN